jgi:hypothetical protein
MLVFADTEVPEEKTASIFRAENGDSMFLRYVSIYQQV